MISERLNILNVHDRSFTYSTDGKDCVTIAPGVTTGELMVEFLNEGKCFNSDVILLGVTYGGVIPTGCHVR